MTDGLNKDWRDWVALNLERGCAKQDLCEIMIREGLDAELVYRVLDYKPSTADRESGAGRGRPGFEILEGNIRRLESPHIDLLVVEDFLSTGECRRLVEIIKRDLRPSSTTDDSDKSFRTSRTCDLGILSNPWVDEIDRRICDIMGIDRLLSEPLQGQYYQVGEEFKPHTDYFEPVDYPEHTAHTGQRTWTFMVYLNTTAAGGETRFPRVDRNFSPRRGRALAWNNLLANGEVNPTTLHHGMPVVRGYKAIVTKWFRQRPPPEAAWSGHD